LGAVTEQVRQFVHVQAEVFFFSQPNRERTPADVVDHGLVNRESRIGIDDLIAWLNQRQNREKDDWLAARHNDHFLGRDWNTAAAAYFRRDGLAKLRKSGRRAVVRPAGTQCIDPGIDDI